VRPNAVSTLELTARFVYSLLSAVATRGLVCLRYLSRLREWTIVGGEWSGSRPDIFTPEERNSGVR
jgi:hypothetical protein